jgi:hypothetical protein
MAGRRAKGAMLSVRIPDSIMDKLKAQAGTGNVSAFVRDVIDQHIRSR